MRRRCARSRLGSCSPHRPPTAPGAAPSRCCRASRTATPGPTSSGAGLSRGATVRVARRRRPRARARPRSAPAAAASPPRADPRRVVGMATRTQPLPGARGLPAETIALEGVARRYRVGDVTVTALEDIDLRVEPGEFVVVLGPSGCGKTTLLNMIGALDSPTEGRVVVGGARHHAGVAQGAVRVPPPGVELRLPDVQPVPGADGARERASSAPTSPAAASRRAIARGDARARRARRPAASTSRTSSRAASSSASRSRARWRRATRRCWPTSRPASSTSGPACRSSSCCTRRPTPGRAVVVVTHNREIARVADRVIELSSGRVVADGAARGRPGRDRRPALVSMAPAARGRGSGGRWRDCAARWLQVPRSRCCSRSASACTPAMSSMSVWRVRLRRRELRRAAHARPARRRWSRAALRPGGHAARGARGAAPAGSVAAAAGAARRHRPRSTRPRRAGTIIVPGRIVGAPARRGRRHARALEGGAAARDADGDRRGRAGATTSPATTTCPAPAALTLAGRAARALHRAGARARVLHRDRAGRGLRRRVGVRGRLRAAADRAACRRAARARQPARAAPARPAPTPAPCRAARRAALSRDACRDPGSRSPRATRRPRSGPDRKDAEGDQQMLDIFAVLLLGAARVRGVQPHQPHRRGAAARDRHRHGARRGAAARSRSARCCWARRSRVAGVVLGIAVGLGPPTMARAAHGRVLPAAGRTRRASRRTCTCRAPRSGSRCRCPPARCPCGGPCGVSRSRRSASAARAARRRGRHGCGAAAPRRQRRQPAAAQRPAHAAPHADDPARHRRGRHRGGVRARHDRRVRQHRRARAHRARCARARGG